MQYIVLAESYKMQQNWRILHLSQLSNLQYSIILYLHKILSKTLQILINSNHDNYVKAYSYCIHQKLKVAIPHYYIALFENEKIAIGIMHITNSKNEKPKYDYHPPNSKTSILTTSQFWLKYSIPSMWAFIPSIFFSSCNLT